MATKDAKDLGSGRKVRGNERTMRLSECDDIM